MVSALRNTVAAKKFSLPPGARWVDYLESTGTQWIDTGWIPTNSARLEIVASMTSTSSVGQFGCIQNGGKPYYNFSTNREDSNGRVQSFVYYFGNFSDQSYIDYRSTIYLNQFFTAIYDGASGLCSLTQQGTQERYASPCNSVPTAPFYLMARNNSGRAELFCKMRISAFDVGSGGNPTLSLRPIAIGTTGYMLDLVSGEYLPYGNKGTGEFIVGPDAPVMTGRGDKLRCTRRSHRRSSRPSARFWCAAHSPRRWEVAA